MGRDGGIIEASSGDKHCDYNDIKRARYFHGMLMTDRDFKEEQLYHNRKRKLLNQTLHGWGVVCGLKVKPTTPAGPNIIVEPGLALDCRGNEIQVCEEQTIDPCVKPPSHTELQAGPCEGYMNGVQPPTTRLYVMIKYKERITDPVPVYAPGGSCEKKVCNYSRTQEGYCIEVWDSLNNNYMQPPVTPESGEVCKNPFPCSDINCCPDPHYILLATISCGPRFDGTGTFGRRLTMQDDSRSVKEEIRYWSNRILQDRVCITPDKTPQDNTIQVIDSYEFDLENSVSDITWSFDWSELPDSVKDSVILDPLEPTCISSENERKCQVSYTLTVKAGAKAGKIILEVPVTLTYTSENVALSGAIPSLQSPIEIGTTDVKRGKTISEAMIRNLEQRKYVPTFSWFAWLLAGNGEGLPWSGDLSAYCTVERVLQAPDRIAMQVARVREDMRKEMDSKIVELEKKNANAIKKIETEYKKKLADMANTIKGLTAKK